MAIAAEHLSTATSFAELGVSPDLVDVLDRAGIASPFPIQALAIPDALAGRDVCGKAKTGSGKTLAFGLPIIQNLRDAKKNRPVALVLVPTRELCSQVTEALRPLAQARGHEVVAIYGGVSMPQQMDALARGAEIVVATPGRLIDLYERKALALNSVEVAVIDEADEMSDLGFLPQVRWIMRAVEGDHQMMLFSATLGGSVGALIDSYMHDPVFHEVASDSVTVETSEHRFIQVHHMDKAKMTARIAASAERMLVFVRTKRGCDQVADSLRDLGVAARPIHGNLPQGKRERMLAAFSDGHSNVLVATNVAARGLDIEGVDIVLHYDPPEDSKTYVHRSGRTARAGEEGLVVTFVEWDQIEMVHKVQIEAGLSEPIVKMFSNDQRLDDLRAWEAPESLIRPEMKRTTVRAARGRRKRR
ncbi:MAG: DEAD/DEAH box helicase [Acidimicrobiia bacterium]|nr:DEAD/DEAH box helicase [Acidimicrobiia bacterium]